MLDFTSALYLGLRHGSRELRPWSCLTTGRPAVLDSEGRTRSLAAGVAALVGADAAVFAPSTLHLFWDAFVALGRTRRAVYLDRGSYPIARWGAERAAAHGVRLRLFRHHDAGALERLLQRHVGDRDSPIVATDGYCPACHAVAPLAEYSELVASAGGLLLVDDTQALGVLGRWPDRAAPYGHGGGGTFRWLGLNAPHLLIAGSMAKGFGVPIAVLAGSAPCLRQFESASETRVHCSPPSAAALGAAQHALEVNAVRGDAIRSALAARVLSFRRAVLGQGLRLAPGLFPVQTLDAAGVDLRRLHRALLARGVRAVLHGTGASHDRLSFLITAAHRDDELWAAASVLADVARGFHRIRPEEERHDCRIPFRA